MKGSNKFPIGVAIILTMVAVGMQKGSIFNGTASAAETNQEESVDREAAQTETPQEELKNHAELEKDEPENQQLATLETEREVSLKPKTDEAVAEKEKLTVQDVNQAGKTSENPKPDAKSDETLVDISKETEIKAESEDKIEPENQVSKTKTISKGNAKSVEEDPSETVKKENYNVEFTYDNLQYVLKGGTSVELREILRTVGLSGTPTNAVSSNDELFTTDKVFGEWVVKSKKAFKTKETLSVTIADKIYDITVTDATVVASGTCGENLNWSLDDEGTLTISGSGEMNNYNSSSHVYAEWSSYRSNILNVIIEEGATTIGREAFQLCRNLQNVSIPSSVTSINDYAFNDCNSLTNVNMAEPSQGSRIGYYVFYGCNSLTSIAIPEGVTEIGKYAFWRCTSLNNVAIPHTVTSIRSQAFRGLAANVDVYCNYTQAEFERTFSEYVRNDAFVTFDDGKATTYKFHFLQDVSFDGVTGDSVTKTYGDPKFTTVLKSGYEGTPTYSSSNPEVATINSQTGEVTIQKAGSAIITASLAATADYLATTKSYTLTVNKADINPTVTLEGWTYGESPNAPVIEGNPGGGAVTLNYGSTGSNPPDDAGSYTLTATIAETDRYNGGEASTTFTIRKASINPTVALEGWTYGESPNAPVVEGNLGGGAVTFTYDSTSSNPPSNAGEHTLKAAIDETSNYLGGEADTAFTIAKADNPTSLVQTAVDGTVGENTYDLSSNVVNVPSQSPDISTVTYSIVSADAKGCTVDPDTGAFTTGTALTGDNPVIVKVAVSATNNYQSKDLFISVNVIEKEHVDLTVSQEGATYGEELAPPSYIKPPQTKTETITYKGILRDGTEYGPTSEKPTEAGTYNVDVECETNDKIYSGNADFAISPKNISDAIVTLLGHLTYNGQEQTQEVQSVIVNGINIMEMCRIEGNTVLGAGNYLLVATIEDDTGNYTGSVAKEFVVDKASSEIGEVFADDLKDTLDPAKVALHRQDETIPGTLSLIETELSYGTHTYHWIFTPDDMANYETATGTVEITVINTKPEPKPEPKPKPEPEPVPEPEKKAEKAENPIRDSKSVKTGDSSDLSFLATLLATSPIGYFLNKKRKKK